MALDAAILARIREWCGSTPDDATVDTAFNLAGNGSVETAALSILRQRRADLLSNPTQFTVVGDYSENQGKNLDALDSQILQLEKLTGTGASAVKTGVLYRRTQGRRRVPYPPFI